MADTNSQGLTAAQMSQYAGQNRDTNAQGLTVAQMSKYAEQMADPVYAAEMARRAQGEANAAQSLAGAKMAPQGTVYDVASNSYKDPLTGNTYIGAANTTSQGQYGAGKPGISQEMGVNPQPGLGGLRFQQGAAGVTPNIPNNYKPLGESPTFFDKRLEIDGTLPGGGEQNPGILSSAAARAEQGAVGADIDITKMNASQLYAYMKAENEAATKLQTDKLERERAQTADSLARQQAQQTETQRAMEYRLGRSDSMYGVSEMAQLAASHRQEIEASNIRYQGLISDAETELRKGNITLAKEMHAQAIQEQQLAMQKEQMYQQTQKYQRDNANETVNAAAKDPSFQPTKEWFDQQDKLFKQPPGYSKNLFNATRSDEVIKQKKDALAMTKDALEVQKIENDLKDHTVVQMKNIEELRKLKQFGEAFTINGTPYYGTDTSTIEIGKDDGIARQMFIDENGKPQVRVIGRMNNADPQKTEMRYHADGTPYFIDKTTGQPTFAPSIGGKTGEVDTQKLFPTGSYGGECPIYVRKFVQVPQPCISKEDKRDMVNVPPGEDPKAMDAVFTSEGEHGHVALVTWTGTDEATGRKVIRVSESNRDLKGTVGTHQYFVDDPKIMGFGRYGLQPGIAKILGFENSGVQEDDEAKYGMTNGGLKIKTSSPFFAEGQTESQHQSAMQKEQEAQTAAEQIMSGVVADPVKEISDFGIRSRALQIASDNGYKKEGEGLEKELNQTFEDFLAEKKQSFAHPEDLRPEYDAKMQTMRAFDAAIRNQAGGITPQRFATFKNNVTEAISRGDLEAAKDRLMTGAFRAEQVDQRKQFQGVTQINKQLDNFSTALDDYIKAGGTTDIFQGTMENMLQKIGDVRDPKLRKLAASMQTALNDYRHQVTGAAFTESEAKLYDELFPGITKSPELNRALIDGLKSGFEAKKDAIMRSTLGNEAMDAFTESIPVMAVNPKTGKQEKAFVSPLEFSSGKYKIAK